MKKKMLFAICLLFLFLVSVFAWEYLRVRKTNSLHDAVCRNDVVELKALLASGADVNQVNEDRVFGIRIRAYPYEYENDVTPLYVAVSTGNPALTELLIERGADVNLSKSCPYTPLGRAIIELNPGIPMHGGPLPVEVDSKTRMSIIEMLVRSGADINASSYRGGETPLEITTRCGFDELHDSLLKWEKERR